MVTKGSRPGEVNKRTVGGTIKCPRCNGAGHIAFAAATVGDMILNVRSAKKLTQQNLSERVGLSRAKIANIEAGRSDLPLKTLARIAEALRVPMRELVPG